jgi:hypothetical protein
LLARGACNAPAPLPTCATRWIGADQQLTLNKCKGDILARFWRDAVEIDDGARITWMCQPRYYLSLYL